MAVYLGLSILLIILGVGLVLFAYFQTRRLGNQSGDAEVLLGILGAVLLIAGICFGVGAGNEATKAEISNPSVIRGNLHIDNEK